MTAVETLQTLLALPLSSEVKQILEWELFWYTAAKSGINFAEDIKRETLPLKLSVDAEVLAMVRERLPVKHSDESEAVIELAASERQPATLRLSIKPVALLPEQMNIDGINLYANTPLSVEAAMLLARLVARYPQLSITGKLQASAVDLAKIPHSFRRMVFRGIIAGRKPSAGLRLLDRFGLLEHFLPEITAGRNLTQNRFHAYDIFEHLLRSVDAALDLNEPVRWAALLHDIGKVPTRVETPTGEATFHNHELYSARMVVPIMKRLAVPIEIGKKVKFLVRNHMFHYTDEWTDRAVRRFVKKVPLEELQNLIALRLADRKGSGKKTAFPKALQKLIDHIDEIIAKEKEFKIKDLAINGHTLMQMGVPPSRQMGDILKYLHAEVVAGRAANEAEILTALARQKMLELQTGQNQHA